MRIDLLHYALIAIIFLLCIVLSNSSRREGAEIWDAIKAGRVGIGAMGMSDELGTQEPLKRAKAIKYVPESARYVDKRIARHDTQIAK